MAYSIDFIKRAVAYKQEGHTLKQLREAFGIPSETYYDWKRKLERGYYEIKVKRERKRKIGKAALKQAVIKKPDAFLKRICRTILLYVCYALEKLTIRRKKRFTYYEKSETKRSEYSARVKRVSGCMVMKAA